MKIFFRIVSHEDPNRSIEHNVVKQIIILTLGLLIWSMVTANSAWAEPYLAVRTGLKCMACHTNPTGGGKRTTFGRSYGQTLLPAEPASEPMGDLFGRYLDIGGDLRTSAAFSNTPGGDDQSAFNTDRANIYLEARLMPERLTLYLDQQFAPGSDSREAWLMLWNKKHSSYLKAGRLFLPYGLRLEDDTAFIRAATGINFSTADNGVEAGLETGPWSLQLALSNGAGGGAETNNGKQISLRGEFVTPRWRLGASANFNKGEGGQDRNMQNLFAGLNAFGLQWLTEIDRIEDRNTISGNIKQLATLFEVNREIRKGHNLKLTLEYLDPDTDIDENQRTRSSLVWEATVLPLLQIRFGARIADGIPQNDSQNTHLYFIQLHGWY